MTGCGRPVEICEEYQLWIRELLKKGYTMRRIEDETGVSRTTVWRIAHKRNKK